MSDTVSIKSKTAIVTINKEGGFTFTPIEINLVDKIIYQQIGLNYEHEKTVQDINKQFAKMGKKINELVDKVNELEKRLDK